LRRRPPVFEMLAAEVAIALHVPDNGVDCRAAADDRKHTRLVAVVAPGGEVGAELPIAAQGWCR
jgi:hypothetical protein